MPCYDDEENRRRREANNISQRERERDFCVRN
jgi:hypothetical protein